MTTYGRIARKWSWIAALPALAIVATFGCGASADELGEVEIGGTMPDFTMKVVGDEDEEVTLSELEGKIVVLEFRCNHCPWIVGADPDYNAMVEAYEDHEEVVFYGINPHDDMPTERILEYAGEAEINRPILRDVGHAYADLVGATRTPEIYIVDNRDPDNMMVLKYHGAFDNRDAPEPAGDQNYVAEALDTILAGDEIEVARVDAWGCTINR